MSDTILALLGLLAWVVTGILGAVWMTREQDDDCTLLAILGSIVIAPVFAILAVALVLHKVVIVKRKSRPSDAAGKGET